MELFKYKQPYFKALLKQLYNDIEKFNITDIKTVFIGGGTPSSIEAKYYQPIFKLLHKFSCKEITIEANPNSATYNWQKAMFDYGVDRISFGVQSFDEKKLKFLGRSHNKTQAIKAINIANQIGFKKINCDIIYDTILDNKTLIQNDLDIIKTLPINHISCYSLSIEKNSLFYNKAYNKKENLQLTYYLFDTLSQMGFKQYEISNFAKQGYESLHNIGYWQLNNYLGIGAGAVGFINNFRYYPKTDINSYIANPTNYAIEQLTSNDIKLEKIFLGFRSKVGVKLDIFNHQELQKIDILVKENKIYIKNNIAYNKNYLLADEISLFCNE